MTAASQKLGLMSAALAALACSGGPAHGQSNEVTVRVAVQRQAPTKTEKSARAGVDASEVVHVRVLILDTPPDLYRSCNRVYRRVVVSH